MFYDLNVPYPPAGAEGDAQIDRTLVFLAELGYETVALSQSVAGKVPPQLKPPPLPSQRTVSATVTPPLTLLSRLTITFSDPAQNQKLSSLVEKFDLVAVRPTNEKCLLLACTTMECDIISLDMSVRLPFHFRFKTVSAAIMRGVRFEICYSPGITGSGYEARRNLIGNAAALIRATRGRGIIVSSEARRALGVRAPADVMNLAAVWGLPQSRAKEAICEEARKTVAFAKLRRTSWRGMVDFVYAGERPQTQAGAAQNKRKAAPDGALPADSEPTISKRERKRQAKQARLDAAAQAAGTGPATSAKRDPSAEDTVMT
ncbi:hypothetical protein KEM52_002412 [Ascosphaera acerosa]|nr:hypothetical protein KEM52_002412 [Ascosphaera acerosa]